MAISVSGKVATPQARKNSSRCSIAIAGGEGHWSVFTRAEVLEGQPAPTARALALDCAAVTWAWVSVVVVVDAAGDVVAVGAAVRGVALVPNLAGLERAHAAGVSDVAIFAAASESFSRRNINQTIDASLETYRAVCARAAGLIDEAPASKLAAAATLFRSADHALRLVTGHSLDDRPDPAVAERVGVHAALHEIVAPTAADPVAAAVAGYQRASG